MRQMLEDDENPNQGARAEFYSKPKQDEAKSLAEGRPVFAPVEYVRIETPGDRSNIVDRPARAEDLARFRAQYRAFKENKNQDEASGTLLSAWGDVPPERIEELAYFRIRTVEQLAALTDENLPKIGPGGMKERQRARDYIETMKGRAPVMQLRAELEKREAQQAAMERQLKEATEAIAELRKAAANPTSKGGK